MHNAAGIAGAGRGVSYMCSLRMCGLTMNVVFARVGIDVRAVNIGWNGFWGSTKRVPVEYHPDRYLFAWWQRHLPTECRCPMESRFPMAGILTGLPAWAGRTGWFRLVPTRCAPLVRPKGGGYSPGLESAGSPGAIPPWCYPRRAVGHSWLRPEREVWVSASAWA
jgi:hypothetical protein